MHRKVRVFAPRWRECALTPVLGYAVTGGQDMVINIFALDSSNKEDPEYSLVGHADNVCAIHVGSTGVIISGSWDKSVVSRLETGIG